MENVSLVFALILVLFSSIFDYTDGYVSCTFDFGLCGWKRISSGQFEWKRGSGQTADRLSGPLNDHTCPNNNGQYIYIPGIESRPNETAILETEHVTITNGTVLTFWYMMHGFGIGALELNIIIGNKTDTLWERRGPQGKDWIKESVNLTPGQSVVIQFKSSVRLPVASDVAIDDIILSSEAQVLDSAHCSKITTEAMTTTSATTTKKHTTNHQTSRPTTAVTGATTSNMCQTNETKGIILPGTCDFETDTCGIKIVSSKKDARVTWKRTNQIDGSMKIAGTSILHDHTLGATGNASGYYMSFVNGNGLFWQNPKYISSLETPTIYASYLCLSFWYSMPHKYSNLKLFVKDSYGNMTEIFNSEDNTAVSKKTEWHLMSMSVTREPPFTIIFQTVNQHFMSRVGIDDIQLLGFNIMPSGTSTSLETTTTTSESPSPTTTESPPTTTTTTESPPTTTAAGAATTTEFSSTTEATLSESTTIQGAAIENRTSTVTESTSTISISTQYSTRKYTPTLTSIVSHSTDKLLVPGKKTTTAAVTKKPDKFDLGEKDALKSENEFKRISLAVGTSVGSLAALAFLAIILYFIISHRRSSRSTHRQNNIGEHFDRNVDSGFSKEKPHFHGIGNGKLNGHITKGFDNHGYCMRENTSMYDKVQIICEDAHMQDKLISTTKSDKITHL